MSMPPISLDCELPAAPIRLTASAASGGCGCNLARREEERVFFVGDERDKAEEMFLLFDVEDGRGSQRRDLSSLAALLCVDGTEAISERDA
jgi:hypothetical protein